MRLFIYLLLVFASSKILAAEESSYNSELNQLFTYSDFGGGDIVFTLKDKAQAQECYGYWVPKSSPNSDVLASQLLAVQFAKAKIRAIGDTSTSWGGSSNKYCKVVRLSFHNDV